MKLRRSPLPYNEATLLACIAEINPLAVDTMVFQAMVTRAHKNVRGSHAAGALHLQLNGFYEAMAKYSDSIGELVEMCGGESLGSVEELADGSRLVPWPAGVRSVEPIVELLFDRGRALVAYYEATLAKLEELGVRIPVNRVLNLQEQIAEYVWKLDANAHEDDDEEEEEADEEPESERGERFMTKGEDVLVGDDGVLRV